jgi:cysteine synthase
MLLIAEGDTVIESSTGNTAIALAMATAVRQYRFTAFMQQDLVK